MRALARESEPRTPRASTPRHEQGRAEILVAAAEMIAARGYHGMSMRDLAAATGRGLASLYNYFDSKEDLLFALQSGAFRTLVETAREAVDAESTPDARLYAFIANHVRYVTEHRDVMRVLVHEAAALPPAHRRATRLLKDAYFALGRQLMAERGVADDYAEIDRATYSLFGMINWTFGWYDPTQHGTPFDVARTILRMTVGSPGGDFRAVETHLKNRPALSPIRPELDPLDPVSTPHERSP